MEAKQNQIQQLQQKYESAEKKRKSTEYEKNELKTEINVLQDEYDRFKQEQRNVNLILDTENKELKKENKRLLEQFTQIKIELDQAKQQILTNTKKNQQQTKQLQNKNKILQQDSQTKQLNQQQKELKNINNDLSSDSSQHEHEFEANNKQKDEYLKPLADLKPTNATNSCTKTGKNALLKPVYNWKHLMQTTTTTLYGGFVYVTTSLWHHIYFSCFAAILMIYFIAVLICDYISSAEQDYVSSTAITILIIALVFEWGLIIIQSAILFRYIFLAEIKPIFCLYLSKIVAFSNIYFLMFTLNKSGFQIPSALTLVANKNPFSIRLAATFATYSVSCQTLTGISSISPKTVVAEFFTAIQILLFGIGYGIFILGVAVLRFAEPDEKQIEKYKSFHEKQIQNATTTPFIQRLVSAPLSSKYIELSNYTEESLSHTPLLICSNRRALSSLPAEQVHYACQTKTSQSSELVKKLSPTGSNSRNSDSLSLSLFPDLDSLESHNIIDHTMRKKIYQASHWMVYVKWIYQHMTLVLFATQTPRLIGMYYTCSHLNCTGDVLLIVGIILDIFILCFSLFCILVRMKLIKTFGIHVNITLKSLLRTYLTLVLIIGVLEFDIWVITKDTSNPAFSVNSNDIDKYWAMIAHFLFYSMATFTNVGSGDNISETGSGRIFANFGMLCGVIFNVVVFGVGLLHLGAQRVIATEKFVKEEILEEKKKKKKEYTYNAIEVAPLSPGDMHQLVHMKSHVLRKQGLLPRAMKPMVHLARQRTCGF